MEHVANLQAIDYIGTEMNFDHRGKTNAIATLTSVEIFTEQLLKTSERASTAFRMTGRTQLSDMPKFPLHPEVSRRLEEELNITYWQPTLDMNQRPVWPANYLEVFGGRLTDGGIPIRSDATIVSTDRKVGLTKRSFEHRAETKFDLKGMGAPKAGQKRFGTRGRHATINI